MWLTGSIRLCAELLVLVQTTQSTAGDRDAAKPKLDEARLRGVVGEWVASRQPVEYALAVRNFIENKQERAKTTDPAKPAGIEMSHVEGKLLATAEGVARFRLGTARWPMFKAGGWGLYSSSTGEPPSDWYTGTAYDGIELSERGIHDDVVFYKRDRDVLLWGKDQSWTKVGVDDVIGLERDASGKGIRIVTPSKMLPYFGSDDLAMTNIVAAELVVYLIDPRRMVTPEDVEKRGEIVSSEPTAGDVEFSIGIPLAEQTAHSISETAKFLEQSQTIPGEPQSGGKVRGGMVVAVSPQYVVKRASVWVQVDSFEDVEKPEQTERSEGVYRFTPIDGGERVEIPNNVRKLLGVEPSATPSVDRWADVLDAVPDAARIPDPGVRDRIVKSGFPWLIRERVSGMEMVLVPPGEFSMGIPDAVGEADEHPKHRVKISAPFYVGRYEVTQSEYVAVMGQNPSFDQRSPRLPVEGVSFEDISARDGFLARTGLRLPTEAEWEYVAHGLKETDYPRGVIMTADCANCLARESVKAKVARGSTFTGSMAKTTEVGSFEESVSWCGAYDMAGNVAEWCSDVCDSRIYEAYARMGTVEDPVGPRLDPTLPHVLRGGSFISFMNDVRCAHRNRNIVSIRTQSYGFRCARTP